MMLIMKMGIVVIYYGAFGTLAKHLKWIICMENVHP
jgi:hypothetical protein